MSKYIITTCLIFVGLIYIHSREIHPAIMATLNHPQFDLLGLLIMLPVILGFVILTKEILNDRPKRP